jgi:type I restriction enzyme M protein
VKNVTCYDPAAGTGTLVIALAHTIGEKRCTIYTQDISDKSSTMMMLNLILNSKADSLSHVVQGNTLTQPYHQERDGSLKKFDYVVSNPPFKLDFSDYQAQLKNDSRKGRFFAGIPNIPNKDKKTMEIYLCFFQHLIYSLNDMGKAAIVVPTGFLTAKSGIPLKIRKHLVDEHILRGVVSMPSNIFANTGTNVSVVFIDKTKKWDTVSLVDASKLGTDTKIGGLKKTVLSDTDVKKIVETFRDNKPVEDFSVSIPYADFEAKGYSFSAGEYFNVRINYVNITDDEFKASLEAHKTSLKQLFEDGKGLEERIIKGIDSLKFNG